jgi:putative acetyltransferase
MRPAFTLTPLTTPADYDLFKDLLLEYAGRDLDDAGNSSIWSDIAQLPGRYAQPAGGGLLVRVNGNLAGCGAFTASAQPGLAEIKRLYVRAEFRRQGLARALTEALVQQLRQLGYQSAAICTWAHNTQALALYRQLGFTPVPCFRESAKAHLLFLGLPLGSTDPDTNPISE